MKKPRRRKLSSSKWDVLFEPILLFLWGLMSPLAKCYFSICIVPHYRHAQQHLQSQIASWNYITSLPLSENYICPPPFHQSLPRLSFFHSTFLPCLTVLGIFLCFNWALNCRAWIALWTAWGGQVGGRCVWMRESPRYHHLFSFSSPSGAVRSQTRYHSRPEPRQGVATPSKMERKNKRQKVNKMVAFTDFHHLYCNRLILSLSLFPNPISHWDPCVAPWLQIMVPWSVSWWSSGPY